MPPRSSTALLVLALAACAAPAARSGTTAPAPAAATAPPAGPGALARLSAEKLIVLPLQGLASVDPLGWRPLAGTEATLIPRIDSLLEAELTGRRLPARWAFASTLSRSARRNPTYLTDPYAIRATQAILVQVRKPEDPLAEPVATQLRGLTGVSDARYALVPLDIRFEPLPPGGRAVLRLALVDTRAARVTWFGEVQGTPHASYSPAVLDDLVQRIADLVVAR